MSISEDIEEPVHVFDTDVFDKLRNLDLWVVDCLRFEPHKSHAHFDKVMRWVEELKPKPFMPVDTLSSLLTSNIH